LGFHDFHITNKLAKNCLP